PHVVSGSGPGQIGAVSGGAGGRQPARGGGWSGVAAGGGRGERDGRGVGGRVARAVACSYVDLVFGVGGQPGQGDRVGGGLAEQRVGGALLPVDVVTRQAGAALVGGCRPGQGGAGGGHVGDGGSARRGRRSGVVRALELVEEVPHHCLGPGTCAVVSGGPVHWTRGVPPVERRPHDRVSGSASRVGGDDVRQAALCRLGRILGRAPVVPDERVAQR